MGEGHRDPERVGYEWAAWWALQGDEPLSRVRDCAIHLQQKLGELSFKMHAIGDEEAEKIAASSNLFMIALAELLDEEGTSEFKAKIERRRRGKPINKHERALKGNKAAALVQRLVDEGWKQEAAIQEAVTQLALSRAEIMTWLRYHRYVRAGGLMPNSNWPNNQD